MHRLLIHSMRCCKAAETEYKCRARLLPRGEREEVCRGDDLDAVLRAAAGAPHALLKSCRCCAPAHHLRSPPLVRPVTTQLVERKFPTVLSTALGTANSTAVA